MGLLATIGKILSLIGGVLVLLQIIFGLLGIGFISIPLSSVGGIALGGILGLIVTILAAIGLILMYKGGSMSRRNGWKELLSLSWPCLQALP